MFGTCFFLKALIYGQKSMRPILLGLVTVCCCAGHPLAQTFAVRTFSAAEVKHLLQDTYQELALKHPGLYRYTPKAAFNRYVDSLQNTITDSLSEPEVYRKLKPFIAKAGCLHTDISLPQQYTDSLNQLANLLPLRVALYRQKLYVISNFSGEAALKPGSEITAINNRPVSSLLAEILPAIATDGYNHTLPNRAVYHLFPLLYRSLIAPANEFTVKVLQEGVAREYTLPAAKYTAIAGNGFLKEPVPEKQLSFTIDNNTAVLTVHTFSASAIKKGGQNFSSFIKEAFTTLAEKHIPNLILDVRNNTGGSDGNAALLCSYFFDTAFRYWDRIVVTEAIAKDIRGATTLFYRKPVLKDSVWLWQKARTVKDFNYYEVQQPAVRNYRGNVWVLINGFCMSSCADVTAVLAHNRKAVFIGEETGGGYQGNNSGLMPRTTLAPTRLQLTVPLQSYYNAVAGNVQVGYGTPPDVTVTESVEDFIAGKDVVMEAALRQIQRP